jgi:hypothetical protein
MKRIKKTVGQRPLDSSRPRIAGIGENVSILSKPNRFVSDVRSYIFSILPIIFVAVPFISIVFYATNYVDGKIVKDTLGAVEPYFLLANFASIVCLLVLNFREIRARFSGVGRKYWIALAAVFLLALCLRMYVAPHTHRVYFDEDIYQDIGKEILLRQKALLCNYGDGSGCYEYDWMKWPNGYPFLLAVGYGLFGISEAVGYNLTALLGSLSAVMVFSAGYLISKNKRIALFAALMLALTPVHIIWSGTTAAEPIMLFFTLLAATTLLLSFESDSLRMFMLALATVAYAMQTKADAAFFLPVAFVMMFFLDRRLRFHTGSLKPLAAWLVFFIFITPYIVHIGLADRTDSWGASGEKIGLEFAQKNIPENFRFWTVGYPTIEHPFIYTILMAIGSLYALRAKPRVFASLAAWFGGFFVIYGLFYAGSVRYGTDVRYALTGYGPYLILSGFGAEAIIRIAAALGGRLRGRDGERLFETASAIAIAATLLVAFYLWYLPSAATAGSAIMEAHGARLYHDFAVESVNRLDKGCYVMSHVPSMFLVQGYGSLQTWNGQNEQRMRELFQKTDCVVFDDGYWCTLPPYKESVCKSMFDKYNLTVLYRATDETEQRTFTFYNVGKPAGW